MVFDTVKLTAIRVVNPLYPHPCGLRAANHIFSAATSRKRHNNMRLVFIKHLLISDRPSLATVGLPIRWHIVHAVERGFVLPSSPKTRHLVSAGSAALDKHYRSVIMRVAVKDRSDQVRVSIVSPAANQDRKHLPYHSAAPTPISAPASTEASDTSSFWRSHEPCREGRSATRL